MTNASLCCPPGKRPPCFGYPCSKAFPLGGLGAHDVNAVFRYSGLNHLMNQRQPPDQQTAAGTAGFSRLVSKDWVRWERLPDALHAAAYDGSLTVDGDSGGTPLIMYDCASSGGEGCFNSSAVGAGVGAGVGDWPLIGLARPENASDPKLISWVRDLRSPIRISGDSCAPSQVHVQLCLCCVLPQALLMC